MFLVSSTWLDERPIKQENKFLLSAQKALKLSSQHQDDKDCVFSEVYEVVKYGTKMAKGNCAFCNNIKGEKI